MVLSAPDEVYRLLQFVALALPAIAIYLQVLSSIHRETRTLEIDGRVPKTVDAAAGERTPRADPYVTGAIPSSLPNPDAYWDYVFALGGAVFFVTAALALVARLLVTNENLVIAGGILIAGGLVLLLAAFVATIAEAIT